RIGDPLEHFEEMAVRTLVFVRGHGRTNASSGFGADTLGNRESVVTELALRSRAYSRSPGRELASGPFAIGIAVTGAALAAVLAVFVHAWPPHEDETLALFVGRGSLASVLHDVIAERGGAPLHFVFAWLVVHLGGGLTA